ncbi:unnamed protein product [Prorocentrum cordatum]|uniref:Uncharacterized protein n=1 Tax=Prorocentrum cordatum TaxID=2364126 RepID=A0ABN9XGQ5_9DINO|nr:unnamed protein product [Polarella glacialis]
MLRRAPPWLSRGRGGSPRPTFLELHHSGRRETRNQSALRQRQGLRAARAAAPPPRAEDPGRRDWEKAHQCGARVAALSAAPVRPGSSSTPVLCRATSGGHLVVVVCP